MINSLKDIIQRCHERRGQALRQRKTVATSAMSGGYPHQFMVYCAHGYRVLLADLEEAAISFMPIGRAPEYDHGPRFWGGKRFFVRQGMKDWTVQKWEASWGIQIYTGIPSGRDGARWHDLDFKYEALCVAPDAVIACIDVLINIVVNPLLTMTKSGSLRFSCRVPEYLHPKTEEERLYIYKHRPLVENPYRPEVYLEIFGEEGYNRWDARYEILLGNLLDPPVISKEILFVPIDSLRAELHEPALQREAQAESVTAAFASLGSDNLNLAKAAFLKRGFSYVRAENGFHHWTRYGGEVIDADILLWEDEGTVWVRASTPNVGLPLEATPITDVWNDTGIIRPRLNITLPVSDKMLAVQEGKLSPLAIKRPAAVLDKLEVTDNGYGTVERNPGQIQRVLDRGVRIVGLTDEAGGRGHYDVETYLVNNNATCLIVPTVSLAEATEHRLQNVVSVARWKDRMYRWDEVKEIPIEVRMATPFQRGNVCEDAERCDALEAKGGNPSESICPQCPVYTVCQEDGYLSQPTALGDAEVQILTNHHLFFNPQYTDLVEEILGETDKTEERVCIIGESKISDLFCKCELSKNILEAWVVNWQGSTLGNFANFLLNALDVRGKPHTDVVKRLRTAMQTFERQEEELARQMCQVNVRGRVVAHGFVDAETEKELARFTIKFESGASAYIPVDDSAVARLMAKGLPFFRLHSFVLNEEMRIPMSMSEAVRLGILDVTTVERIQGFPTVCPNPNWTFWHQLKHFFACYTRDADAPIRWDYKVLRFKVLPVLHTRVKRLLLMAATHSERHLRRAFPDEGVEVSRIRPTPWLTGNQVFQIRTGLYARATILDHNTPWNQVGISEIGEHLLLGIRAEIERNPSVKHAIFADEMVRKKLEQIIENKNICFLNHSTMKVGVDTAFETAEVIWIVGTPVLEPDAIWHRSQILFGNAKNPLCYEREKELVYYKDKRVESVHEAGVVRLLTEVVGLAQLNRMSGKKLVLVTSIPLPDITDRPETLLFDWEDFEIAGGLDKLAAVIETRQRFERERENLPAESSRAEVQRILGCSARQANRFLKKLRGGNIPRVLFRDQIHSLLTSGEKKTAELIEAIDGHPEAIKHELRRLVDADEIVRIRRGVYALP